MKLAGIFFQLATKIHELEPRPKVAKLFCQWLGGDRTLIEKKSINYVQMSVNHDKNILLKKAQISVRVSAYTWSSLV